MIEQQNQPLYDSALRCHQAGRGSDAELLCRKILRTDPAHADALHLLGVVAHQSGRHAAAADLIGQAISQNADNPLYHSNLGATLQALGQVNDAVASCRRAVDLRPTLAASHYNLGRALQANGDGDAAETAYRRTLQLEPQHAEARLNLGNLLYQRGEIAAAAEEFRRSIQCNPRYAYAHYNLGNALFELGRHPEAIESLRTTITLKPDFAEAYNNLGKVYRSGDRLDDALTCFSTACRLKPHDALVQNNRASVLQSQGRIDEALADYRRSRQLNPRDAAAHSNLLVAENNVPENSPHELFRMHLAWAREHAAAIPPMRTRCLPEPQRRLRIGYVSPDFRTHPVAHFFLPLVKRHDRELVEVICYSNVERPDRTTQQIQQLSDHFRDTREWSDDRLAETIASDEIDILVDLAGHTARNRLLVFARKPAPVQVSYLGYPNTTGLEAIDYRFTDAVADPPHHVRTHCETLVNLPGPFCCYSPPKVDISPQVSSRRGAAEITFGSLHNLAKLNSKVLDVWSEILQRVPRARLLIARSTLSRTCRERLAAEFAQRGVPAHRLDLRQLSTTRCDYLQIYAEIDVMLDAFPWCGHTTTCEALWMGVPVLTLCGDRHAGRMGASLLTHVGLHEWITESTASYVTRAAELAADCDRLRGSRLSVRQRLLDSPVCQARRYAEGVEAAFRTIWRRYCATQCTAAIPETSFVIDTTEVPAS